MKFSAIHQPRDERGIATIAVAAAMSAFAVLALTVLTNAPLRVRMSTDTRDLHVVLYKADTGLQTLAGRLNIPSASAPSGDDTSTPGVALEIPIPADPQVGADGPWSHVVQLAPGLRVCCESGEAACADVDPAQASYEGSANYGGANLAEAASGTEQQLHFDLEPVALDDGIARELPPYESATASLLKATRKLEAPGGVPGAATAMSCRLEHAGRVVATGWLSVNEARVHPDAAGAAPSPTVAGSLRLRFGG